MGIAIRPSTRRINKATKRFAEWQRAAATAAGPVSPTRQMQRTQQRQFALQGKVARVQAKVAMVLAKRAAVRARRPALLRWTPLLNRRERKLNERAAALQASERAEVKVFKALESAEKAELTAIAKKKEADYKKAETKLSKKIPALKKQYATRIRIIERMFGASMHASLNARQQAKLAGWFNDAKQKINGISTSPTIIAAHGLLQAMQEKLQQRRYRQAARLLFQITKI